MMNIEGIKRKIPFLENDTKGINQQLFFLKDFVMNPATYIHICMLVNTEEGLS